MKLSSYRRIYEQDYEGQYQSLIKKLGIPLNASFTDLYNALNNNLTFQDNFNCTVITFTVTVDENGSPNSSTQFKLASYQKTFSGLTVLSAFGSRDPNVLPTAGVYVSAKLSGDTIIIQNIKGLQASMPYSIKVIAFS